MLVAARNTLLILFGAIAVFLVPFIIMPMLGQPSVSGFLVPLVLIFEFVVYFLYISFGKEIGETLPYIICAAGAAVVRFLASLSGALYISILGHGDVGNNLLTLWVGHPLAVLLQIGVLLLLLPHVIALVAPGMLAEASRKKIESLAMPSHQPSSPQAAAALAHVTPLGGFVRTYDYTEMESFFRKIVGLEGFVLFSDEGLVIWKDLQMRLDVDTLVVRYHSFDREIGGFTRKSGLHKVQRWIVQTREHIICCLALGSQFYLLLFFNTQLALAEIISKLDVVVRTAQELVNMRYGGSLAG